MKRQAVSIAAVVAAVVMMMWIAGCGGKKAPVARPAPPPPPPAAGGVAAATTPRPPAPPEPVGEPIVVPPEPVREDAISSGSLDDLNRNSPLKPVFFEYDSSELTPAGQAALNENAPILRRYPRWAITIEGHCEDRKSTRLNSSHIQKSRMPSSA